MTDNAIPHFHNEPGASVVEIGAKEFMCVGALPPFDHPHVFLDMGGDSEIICPYCSTLYRLDPAMGAHAARPEACALRDTFGTPADRITAPV
ncbi:MAG: zinc-finger domain-containing protein [Pseudorhodoplanes sp.]